MTNPWKSYRELDGSISVPVGTVSYLDGEVKIELANGQAVILTPGMEVSLQWTFPAELFKET